ncbi:hypothetical protein, partial [Photobacterium ganghwense]
GWVGYKCVIGFANLASHELAQVSQPFSLLTQFIFPRHFQTHLSCGKSLLVHVFKQKLNPHLVIHKSLKIKCPQIPLWPSEGLKSPKMSLFWRI